MLQKLMLTIGLVWCLISLGQARQEKTVEECEKNIGKSLKDRVCELRQYTPVNSPDMDKHMQCVLEVVGFVDASGKVLKEVLLGLLKKVDARGKHDQNVQKCVEKAGKVNNGKKANTFYTCLLSTSSQQAFKDAVDYNELLKAGKLKKNDPFVKDKVSKLIKLIDDKLC